MAEEKSSPQRRWCGTLNNYSEEEYKLFTELPCKYSVIGKEVGEGGTPHLQMYFIFERTCRMSSLKRLCARVHWEAAIADEMAAAYCMKEGDYVIKDTRAQGKRTDLLEVRDFVKESRGDIVAVMQKYPAEFLKYGSNLKLMCSLACPPRDFAPIVCWIWGATGHGKTRSVVDWCAKKNLSLWVGGGDLNRFWNGYMNQEAVLFDDFRPSQILFNRLLQVLDRYPCVVETKGSYTQLNSKFMFITCNAPPDNIGYDCSNEDIKQLTRRINTVCHADSADFTLRENEEKTDS